MYLYCTSDRWKYLALSGLFFGIGAATKWTCLYAGAGLGVIWLCHWILKGKGFKFGAFVKNCLLCLVFFVLIPGIIYYASYYPYGQAKGLEGLGMLMVCKVVLSSLLFGGGFSAMLYSLAGGVLSLVVMLVLVRVPKVGVIGVSACGAICHNLGQIAMTLSSIRRKLQYIC